MGRRCAVKDCKNYDQWATGLTFHRLPASNEMRQQWLNALPPDSLRSDTKTMQFCSEHFTLDCFQPAFLGLTKRMLKRTAVPTIFNCATKCTNNGRFMDNEQSTSELQSQTDPLAIGTSNNDTMLFGLRHEIATQTMPTKMNDVYVQTYTRNLKPSDRELQLKKENRILKQRLRRRDQRITTLKCFIQHLKDKYIEEEITCADDDDDDGVLKEADMDCSDEEEFNIIVVE